MCSFTEVESWVLEMSYIQFLDPYFLPQLSE